MNFAGLNNLRQEKWKGLNSTERFSALQELENQLAVQENRIPETLRLFPNPVLEGTNGFYASKSGMYQEEDGKNQYYERGVYINPALLEKETPFLATETTFHEAEHAFQHHCVENPEVLQDSQQVEDWRKNQEGGYLRYPKKDFSLYRFQPVENDANQVARERTNELFEGHLGDQQGYSDYRSNRESINEQDHLIANYKYGPAYKEVARNAMLEEYEKSHGEDQNQSSTEKPVTQPINETKTGQEPSGKLIAQEENEPVNEEGTKESANAKTAETMAMASNPSGSQVNDMAVEKGKEVAKGETNPITDETGMSVSSEEQSQAPSHAAGITGQEAEVDPRENMKTTSEGQANKSKEVTNHAELASGTNGPDGDLGDHEENDYRYGYSH